MKRLILLLAFCYTTVTFAGIDIHFYNNTGSQANFTLYRTNNCTVPPGSPYFTMITVNAGQTDTRYGVGSGSSHDCFYVVWKDSGLNVISTDFADLASTSEWTTSPNGNNNHACYSCVSLQNTNEWGAHWLIMWIYGSGGSDQAGIGYTGPHATLSQCFTNYITGADWASRGSACPYLQIYDTADPDPNRQLKYDQQSTDNMVASGGTGNSTASNSGGVNGPGPDPNGTNSATGGDLGKMTAAIQLSLDALLNAIRTKAEEMTLRGFTNISGAAYNAMIGQLGGATNYLSGIRSYEIAVSNLLSSATNYAAVYGGWQTNHLASLTNLLSQTTNFLGAIRAQTNYFSMATNLLTQATNWSFVMHNGLTNLLGQATNLLVGTTNYLSNLTNSLTQATNLLSGATNYLAGVSNRVGGVSNVLAEILKAMTNNMNDGMAGIGSDAASGEALSAASGLAMSNAVWGGLSRLPDVSGWTPAADGLAYVLDMGNGCPVWSANLIPPQLTGLVSFISRWFAWILCMAYLTKCIVDSMEVVRTMSTAQQFHIPQWIVSAFGFGGNIGLAVAPVVLTVLLSAYGALIGWLGTTISGGFSDAIGVWTMVGTNPLTGAGGVSYGAAVENGLKVLMSFIPLNVIIGLSVSYLIFRLTLTNALAALVLAFRVMAG